MPDTLSLFDALACLELGHISSTSGSLVVHILADRIRGAKRLVRSGLLSTCVGYDTFLAGLAAVPQIFVTETADGDKLSKTQHLLDAFASLQSTHAIMLGGLIDTLSITAKLDPSTHEKVSLLQPAGTGQADEPLEFAIVELHDLFMTDALVVGPDTPSPMPTSQPLPPIGSPLLGANSPASRSNGLPAFGSPSSASAPLSSGRSPPVEGWSVTPKNKPKRAPASGVSADFAATRPPKVDSALPLSKQKVRQLQQGALTPQQPPWFVTSSKVISLRQQRILPCQGRLPAPILSLQPPVIRRDAPPGTSADRSSVLTPQQIGEMRRGAR